MESRFKVVFCGELISEYEINQVKQNLAALYKVPLTKIDPWFSGKPVTIRKGLAEATARKYKKAFEKAGAICTFEPEEQTEAVSQPNQSSPESQQPVAEDHAGQEDLERETATEDTFQPGVEHQHKGDLMSSTPPSGPGSTSQNVDQKRSKLAQKFHLFGSPVVVLVLFALALPFISVSCHNQKILTISGYQLFSQSRQGSAEMTGKFSIESAIGLKIAIALIIFSALGISTFAVVSVTNYRPWYIWTGMVLCLLGLLITLWFGDTYGIRAEKEINARQAQAVQDSQARASQGAQGKELKAMAASLKISVDMDAGYYLILAAFILGLGAFSIPFLFSKRPLTKPNIVAGAVMSFLIGLLLVLTLFLFFKERANPAKSDNIDKMGNVFESSPGLKK